MHIWSFCFRLLYSLSCSYVKLHISFTQQEEYDFLTTLLNLLYVFQQAIRPFKAKKGPMCMYSSFLLHGSVHFSCNSRQCLKQVLKICLKLLNIINNVLFKLLIIMCCLSY